MLAVFLAVAYFLWGFRDTPGQLPAVIAISGCMPAIAGIGVVLTLFLIMQDVAEGRDKVKEIKR